MLTGAPIGGTGSTGVERKVASVTGASQGYAVAADARSTARRADAGVIETPMNPPEVHDITAGLNRWVEWAR